MTPLGWQQKQQKKTKQTREGALPKVSHQIDPNPRLFKAGPGQEHADQLNDQGAAAAVDSPAAVATPEGLPPVLRTKNC